jgi:leucyl-tRNA synthetase
MKPFNPAEIEAAVQREWRDGERLSLPSKPPTGGSSTAVSMLPYPSGILHMGTCATTRSAT